MGEALGTPGYLPLEAGLVDPNPSFDVFGLGATLYQLLTGKLPREPLQALREAHPGCDAPDDLGLVLAAALALGKQEVHLAQPRRAASQVTDPGAHRLAERFLAEHRFRQLEQQGGGQGIRVEPHAGELMGTADGVAGQGHATGAAQALGLLLQHDQGGTNGLQLLGRQAAFQLRQPAGGIRGGLAKGVGNHDPDEKAR
jgi:hypothetical protein